MEETKFDMNIRKKFQNVFGDDLLRVSTNYIDVLRLLYKHLCSIYNDKPDWHETLNKYLQESRTITSLDDIEEVSEEDIFALLEKEENYTKKVSRLLEINDEMSEKEIVWNDWMFTLIQEAMDIIGLTGKEESLLTVLLPKNKEFIQKPEAFRTLGAAFSMIVNETAKLYVSGMQLSFPNTGMVSMTQGKGRCFYRGENAYYTTSRASAFRGKIWSEIKEPVFDYIVWKLRLYECFDFFDHFDVVGRWDYSDVNYLALAQHYGLRTTMLDITTNLKTALFFACCKADSNGLDWHPLSKKDFIRRDSRRHIAALGGDSQYGVLHYVPTDIVDCQWLLLDKKKSGSQINPIGYQPFMRCSTQYGYMMNTDEKYDLMRDKLFRKVKFRHSESLCNWIYEEMDGGKRIYPNDEDIARVADIVRVVSGINSRTEFSKITAENVRLYLKKLFSVGSKEEIDPIYYYKNLKRFGIKIKDRVELLTEKNIRRINTRYTLEKVHEKIESPKVSPIFIIG